ncbi:MAG: phosphate ABC transporter permease PstA [Alphaproteobacteria bacterium]|jgi:phosphate transport system permease protein|nr:phosphate ABC transporter permease PstA [Alphaproteobacteria bacterium]
MSLLLLRRRLFDALVIALSLFATAFTLFWLAWILWTTISQGASALKPSLFTEMTPAPGAPGGLANALFGSVMVVAIGVILATPIGVLAAIYLAEYKRGTRVAGFIGFVNDILLSAPSIVIGLFIYELFVLPFGHFSGYAGGIALAMIMLPIVVRSSAVALELVPSETREAALALGLPRWKVTWSVIVRAARPGIITGLLLGVARISGETAPLLFTALNNQYWSANPATPLANIPVVIFQYAMSPYDDWHALAWAGAFLVMLFVLGLGLATRLIFRQGGGR